VQFSEARRFVVMKPEHILAAPGLGAGMKGWHRQCTRRIHKTEIDSMTLFDSPARGIPFSWTW